MLEQVAYYMQECFEVLVGAVNILMTGLFKSQKDCLIEID